MKMEMEIEDQNNWHSSNEMLQGMCRLCLCSCNDENSVEIFFTNDLSLNVRIMACVGLEVCLIRLRKISNALILCAIV